MGKPCNAATYRAAAAKLAADYKCKILVEVGVYAGDLSRLLANLPDTQQLEVVDSWKGGYSNFSQSHMDKIAAGVMDWGAHHPKVQVHRMDSLEAALLYPNDYFDYFHTDGDHSLAGIMGDIRAWYPKVKPGGILCGDNYEIPAVAQGVSHLLPQHQLLANGRLWWAIKPALV